MKKSLGENVVVVVVVGRSACTGARNLTTWKNQASMFLSFHDNGAAVATKERKEKRKIKAFASLFFSPEEE